MTKKLSFLVFLTLILSTATLYAFDAEKDYDAKGEVTSVDPLYGSVSIQHDAIKGFSESGDTQFFVTDPGLLKEIARYDLVEFHIRDSNGDVRVDKIVKTGVAAPKSDGLPVGKAVQDVLTATGETAKALTSPITPVHDTVGNAVGETTTATGTAVEDATVPDKSKF